MKYYPEIENNIIPKLKEKKVFYDQILLKYKSSVIEYVQEMLNKKYSGKAIWDDDDEYTTKVKPIVEDTLFKNIDYLDVVIFYFVISYLKYKFLILKDKSVLSDLIELSHNLDSIDYTDTISAVLDFKSLVLDDVSHQLFVDCHIAFENKILNDEYSDNELLEILDPKINELLLTLYSGNIKIEQYIYAKYGLLKNKDILKSLFGILNLRDKSYSRFRYYVGSVLFNFNYLDYLELENEEIDIDTTKEIDIEELSSNTCDKWRYIREIIRSAQKAFNFHESSYLKLDPFYKDIAICPLHLPNKNNDVGCFKYLDKIFQEQEYLNILLYAYMVFFIKKIAKIDSYGYIYIKQKQQEYMNVIWNICKDKDILIENEDELNLFAYIMKIYLTGNTSVCASLRKSSKVSRNFSALNKSQNIITFNIENIKKDDSLNDIFNYLLELSKKENIKPVQILGIQDKSFLEILIENCIHKVGTVKTVEFLNRNKLSSYFWEEIDEMEKMERVIPIKNIPRILNKF